MKELIAFSIVTILLLPAACEEDGRDADDDADGSASDADTDSDSDSDSDSDGDACAEGAEKIYVVDSDESLYSFDPEAAEFSPVGVIDCPGPGTPFSMSVSREGIAYVLYWDSLSCVGINAVDITDASCIGDVGFACGQAGFDTFGMGFATDSADTTAEQLYVGKSTTAGSTLASLDTSSWELTPIGPITSAPELTGNALGELWGFYAWMTPPMVARIDKSSGSELETYSFPELAGNAAFAFAHWGGDYYLFHAPAGDTAVYKLSDGELTTYLESTGLYIVGAGVSTCAPVSVE